MTVRTRRQTAIAATGTADDPIRLGSSDIEDWDAHPKGTANDPIDIDEPMDVDSDLSDLPPEYSRSDAGNGGESGEEDDGGYDAGWEQFSEGGDDIINLTQGASDFEQEDDDENDPEIDIGMDDDDDDEQDQSMVATNNVLGQAMLDDHLHFAKAVLASSDASTTIVQVHNDIRITFLVDDIDKLAREACALSFHPINVTLTLTQSNYRRTATLPEIRITHGELETSTRRTNKRFPIGLQLTQVIRIYFTKTWDSARNDEFLLELCQRVADRIKNAGTVCMMCDSPIFPGVKPTVCDKMLCAYQFENLGLGADLSLFGTDSKVADLLLTFAVSALSDEVRLRVSPVTLPPARDDEQQLTAPDFHKLLLQVPSVHLVLKDLSEAVRLEQLKEVDPRIEGHLAWIFATNRAHIASLPEARQFEVMRTPHQFQIHTSTREHAAKFEKLRAAHGSFLAFHGSRLSNWHNILRQNLKNASNTPLMSAGAAFGEGIYMALNSMTSSGYSLSTSGWGNSEFGSWPSCIALVEVANSSRIHKHANSIVVAADDSCVMLRYLFIYEANVTGRAGIPSVAAETLNQNRFCNTTTIAYGSTYEEVFQSGNLLLTDNDTYFWDIDELVLQVQSAHGLFINGYTSLPFAPQDVAKILAHPKAAVLKKMEADNAAFRKLIPQRVIDHLRSVGAVCARDQSAEFSVALPAIAKLQEYLAALDKPVVDAFARVPFTTRDSHTGKQLRDTVAHAVELVTSGGECVHRFGDFLMNLR